MNTAPIGIFDSGCGGLSVFKELRELMPHENLIYFGDTARVPYGTRSADTIKKFVEDDMHFLNTFNPKFIVVACGTASCVGGSVVKANCKNSVLVISPSAIAAAKATKNKRIGVISTSATLKSGAFEKKIKSIVPNAEVFCEACPAFVNIVEYGWISEGNPIAREVVKEYMKFFKDKNIDTLILGCTHFPLLSGSIAKVMGKNVTLINSGYETALAAKMALEKNGMLNTQQIQGTSKFYVSDDADSFAEIGKIFLGEDIADEIQKVKI